jgi:PAS domain S-box-containing protein
VRHKIVGITALAPVLPEVNDPSSVAFLSAQGEMAARMRGHDWAGSPLGPPSTWSTSLKTLVGLMLASPQPMFMAWGAARTWLYNDAFIPILGVKHPAALGRHAIEEVWREARDSLLPMFDRVYAGEPVHMQEFRLQLDRHGTLEDAYFTFSYIPARDDTGEVAGLFGACIETTDRVLAEQRQAATQARQQRMFEQAPSFMCILRGPEHVYDFVNKAHRKLFNSDTWIGKPVRDAFPDIANQGYLELLDQVYISGERYVATSAPVRYRRTPGGPEEERLLDFIYEPITDDDGRVTGVFCEGFDVTEARRSELALRESEERLRAIVETTPECVKLVARDGTVLQMNPSGLAMIEAAAADEVIGRNVFDLIAPEHREAFRRFNECVCNGDKGTMEFDVIGLRGSRRHMETHGAPLRMPDGTIVQLGVTRDVTARRVAEEALRESDRRKDEFIATLSHELRNPLAPLRNALQILQTRTAQDPGAASTHEMMARQVNHLVRLVDDLLEVSRIKHRAFELRSERVELATVVRNAVETCEPLMREAGHCLDVSLPNRRVWLYGDPVRLGQILTNLLNNAARYTPPHGRISIHAHVANGILSITVLDTGAGFAQDAGSRLFEMFSRGKQSSGLGVGLALARRLAELHGGTIKAASAGPGQGAEFTVSLPLPPDQSGMPAETRQDWESFRDHRILVVDDNRDAAESIRALLELLEAEVRVAFDGAHALELFREYDANIVLLDIGMPGMDGYEVARAMREHHPDRNVQIVALTGWGQEQDRARTREAGFDHHLVKPVDFSTLQGLFASLPTVSPPAPTPDVGSERGRVTLTDTASGNS